MLSEFSARDVTLGVLEHLERRRPALVSDEDSVPREVRAALAPVRAAYREAELPPAYFDALEKEVIETVPAAWLLKARPFTELEKRDFGLWRGGDPVARIAYAFAGLFVGGICVALPFVPIWSDWFPFVLAISAWFTPNLQLTWHRRRYARALGDIALRLEKAQPRLDAHFDTAPLLSQRDEHPSDK